MKIKITINKTETYNFKEEDVYQKCLMCPFNGKINQKCNMCDYGYPYIRNNHGLYPFEVKECDVDIEAVKVNMNVH